MEKIKSPFIEMSIKLSKLDINWLAKKAVNNTNEIKADKAKVRSYKIVSVLFMGKSSTKLYDYLLENRSKHSIVKDQVVNLITGTWSNQQIMIKHLKFYDRVPSHITKKIIVTTPTAAIIGALNKGGK